ncbi:NAD-dependent epimerase/dehydratase family protein [Gammaproteobacteria bacterium]|nr:NAD-dependent epimerase/dehydratase family protein [Gammaproteobacteria bacterium]
MSSPKLSKILITGGNGFIGRNLKVKLDELSEFKISIFTNRESDKDLTNKILDADFIVHLAGVNRPVNSDMFTTINKGLTSRISKILTINNSKTPLIFSSSTQATLSNDYGKSKLDAENILKELSTRNGNPISIFRLPGVFGKWCRPNYNSVVATFCYNIANDLPIEINDENANLSLVHIDDVIESFIYKIKNFNKGFSFSTINNELQITVGDLADKIKSFKNSRSSLVSENVGTGAMRSLYSTYLSYLPPNKFSYVVPSYTDERGVFVEMLKTKHSGQFSFFTAKPGITRGGHYHHTKTEKFLILKGNAKFHFRHILSNETYTLETSEDQPEIVETIPGWAHDISNIGDDDLVVMLWANEIFDTSKPDTFSSEVQIEKA